MLKLLSWSVSPEAHALLALSAALNKNVPAVAADHTEMSVMVSEVPPFVHDGVLLMAMEPAEAAEKVVDTRVVEPAEMDVVPAVPGGAV